jgi:hypothetical protein
LVTVLLGLDPDVPAGRTTTAPLPGFGELRIDGVRVGGSVSSFTVDGDGRISSDRP